MRLGGLDWPGLRFHIHRARGAGTGTGYRGVRVQPSMLETYRRSTYIQRTMEEMLLNQGRGGNTCMLDGCVTPLRSAGRVRNLHAQKSAP